MAGEIQKVVERVLNVARVSAACADDVFHHGGVLRDANFLDASQTFDEVDDVPECFILAGWPLRGAFTRHSWAPDPGSCLIMRSKSDSKRRSWTMR